MRPAAPASGARGGWIVERLGLALSGGGFRATLFHLGVVRCLRDAGLLAQVTHIASVSGGSITAAHLALQWDRYTGSAEDFDAAADELVRFAQLDIRNRIARRYALWFPVRLLMRLAFRRPGRRYTLNGLLEDFYSKYLYGDARVHELPERPDLHILATNVSEGFLSSFHRGGLLMQRRSESDPRVDALPGRLARVSMAVAASSAFPGFFPPVEIGAEEIGLQAGEFASHTFTDGGVYDNLGVRAFAWLTEEQGARLDDIFVSDAGQLFRIIRNTSIGFVANAMRATDVLWDRVGQLERQSFGSDPRFLFIPIVEQVDPASDPSAAHEVLQPEIQNIRTDLDRFTPLEISALVTHGYAVARQRLHAEGERRGVTVPEGPAWDPFAPAEEAGAASVSPLASVEGVNERARKLQRSSSRKIWSALLDHRDPVSAIYVPLLVLLFVVLPLEGYRLYDKAQTNAMVVQAIANGDPEFKSILELFETDPVVDWVAATTEYVDSVPTPSYEGYEVLSDTRIVDLRRWSADQPDVYSLRRIRVRKEPGFAGDGVLRFDHFVPLLESYSFRLAPEAFSPMVRIVERDIEAPTDTFGDEANHWQTAFDLSALPVGQAVDLTIEGIITLAENQMSSTVAFTPAYPTAVASTWLLFPDHKPYRRYDLLRYVPGDEGEPRHIEPRFVIDHPLGSIIAWSVTNARAGHVYECTWEWQF